MPTAPDVELVSSWEEVDEAALSVKNGLQKEQLAAGVRASLDKADDAWARLYWVTISRSGGSYTCDKTLAEIQSAQLAGAFVRAHLPDGFEADLTNDDGGAMFYALDNSGGPMVLMRYTVAASGVSFNSWPIGGSGSGLTEEIKQALLACFAHVAWADEHGQDYYDALEDALYPPVPVTLLSITADYQQDHTIYDTDPLDAIKVSDDLTVTANYSDGSSVVLDDDDYTLSGTLTVGTSTITVSYEGKTTTISVLVLQDTRIMRKAVISDLASTIGLTNPSFDSNGSLSATGYQTFSVAAFLETIKKITYKSRYSVYRFIFRKEQDGSFYGIDSTKVFKFTPSGTTKYTATEVADPTTITTRTGAGAIDQNDIATITIDGNGVYRAENENGDYVTLTNANVIGFWMSNTSQANVLSYCEVLA